MSSSSTRCEGAIRWLWASLPAAALLLAGCGPEPGDYIVYRVNLTQAELSNGCYYPSDEPPPGTDESGSTHNASATWVLYFAAGDRLVLDIETNSLEGVDTDDGYAFEANTIDTSYLGIDQLEAKVTVVQKETVDMVLDGTVIEGELLTRTSTTCEFLTATPSSGLCNDVPDCARTREFSGVELEDVTIESGVDKPNPF